MASERVTVSAGGMSYEGWESVTITAAIDEACRTFEVATTERPGEFSFPPGTPVTISASGALLLTGYVNEYKPSGDGTSHKISISGRGKGQDMVDSAAMSKTGNFEKKDPGQIAKELDKFKIGIRPKVKLDKIPYYQLKPGETAFSAVERALRGQGAVMMGKPDGSVEITNASVAKRHGGALTEGVNILKYSGHLSDQNRNSEYACKGQNRKGSKKKNLRVKQTVKDSSVKRYRPKVLINETDTDDKRAKKRAQNEKDRAEGASIKATITVQGWRDPGGQLWEPNRLVFVASPTLLHLEQDMLVERVVLRQSESGTIAELQLVDPRTYKGKGGKGGKKGKGRRGRKSRTSKAWK